MPLPLLPSSSPIWRPWLRSSFLFVFGFSFFVFCLCVRPPCLFLSHSCCLERESIGTKMGYKRYEGESEEKRKQPIKAGTFGLTKEKSRVDTQSLIRICSPQAAVHTLKEFAGSIARGFGYKITAWPWDIKKRKERVGPSPLSWALRR